MFCQTSHLPIYSLTARAARARAHPLYQWDAGMHVAVVLFARSRMERGREHRKVVNQFKGSEIIG